MLRTSGWNAYNEYLYDSFNMNLYGIQVVPKCHNYYTDVITEVRHAYLVLID